MQLQSLKKGGYLVAAMSAVALSLGTIIPQAIAQRNINAYCFRRWGSETLTYGADASSTGRLTASVYHNNKLVKSISSSTKRNMRDTVQGVSGDRTWKVVATGANAASDTCIVT